MAQLSSAEATKRQEKTSAWIFRRALNDNINYNSPEEVLKDPKFKKDILGFDAKTGKSSGGIYPEVMEKNNISWLETFYLQQKKFLNEFSDVKFSEFTRDGGFMKYISDLVKNKFGISKKDTWDPADIWCIQNEKKVISEINKLISLEGKETIEELNTLLRTYFKKRIVVGISLKKVTGRDAYYEEVNVTKGILFENVKAPAFKISEMRCDLDFRPTGKMLKATGSMIEIDVKTYENKIINYTLSMRSTSTSRFNNLSMSFFEKGGDAQIGRVPIEKFVSELKLFGQSFDKTNGNYPKSAAEYIKEAKKYTEMFNNIKNEVETGLSTAKEFNENMLNIFKKDPVIGNTKLMQIALFDSIVSINKKKREQFVTNIFFFAEKRGDEFGPFGKIY